MRFPVNHALPLAALILLGAGGGAYAADRHPSPPDLPATGPAADYPVVVGEPFTIGGTTWTPVDQLNYDAVGQALVGEGAGVTGAHKTLPLPSYVEVTALDSGRTILVRLERRGPMTNDALVELSPDAAAQLGLQPGHPAPVRVRRVNPPEQERALLRADGRAPDRMATPEGLLKVLRRKLVDQSPLAPLMPPPAVTGTAAPASVGKPAPVPVPEKAKPAVAKPPVAKPPVAKPAAPSVPAPKPATATPRPTPPQPAARGAFVVQVATFSSQASARKVAAQLGGSVSPAGKFWRVRLGGYPNRAQAAAALEKAKTAGYSDARIQSAD
jgi:rare lipoprotein A